MTFYLKFERPSLYFAEEQRVCGPNAELSQSAETARGGVGEEQCRALPAPLGDLQQYPALPVSSHYGPSGNPGFTQHLLITMATRN